MTGSTAPGLSRVSCGCCHRGTCDWHLTPRLPRMIIKWMHVLSLILCHIRWHLGDPSWWRTRVVVVKDSEAVQGSYWGRESTIPIVNEMASIWLRKKAHIRKMSCLSLVTLSLGKLSLTTLSLNNGLQGVFMLSLSLPWVLIFQKWSLQLWEVIFVFTMNSHLSKIVFAALESKSFLKKNFTSFQEWILNKNY